MTLPFPDFDTASESCRREAAAAISREQWSFPSSVSWLNWFWVAVATLFVRVAWSLQWYIWVLFATAVAALALKSEISLLLQARRERKSVREVRFERALAVAVAQANKRATEQRRFAFAQEIATMQAAARVAARDRPGSRSRRRRSSREDWWDAYARYLQTPEWRAVRDQVLIHYAHRCSDCGKRATQVHHIRYTKAHQAKDFRVQPIENLVALCFACHQAKHIRS